MYPTSFLTASILAVEDRPPEDIDGWFEEDVAIGPVNHLRLVKIN